ncbi:hypothetical protein BLX87_03810 [Bacillus sp. VT-16-64]|nr:hypothetical protein BLX87_03810 [Bacillus sp. VT-16-64]
MVKNLPVNAGVTGWIPGRGTKIPQASEQLSPLMLTTEGLVPWIPHNTTSLSAPAKDPARGQQRSCVPQLRLHAAK